MRKLVPVLVVLAALGLVLLEGCGAKEETDRAHSSRPVTSAPEPPLVESTAPPAPFAQENFVNRRTINYVASDPPNNALLSTPVDEVTIYFSKGLGAGSFINVSREGLEVMTGSVVVALDNRSMYVPVAAGVTGNYKVKYAAYFATGYYEEGSFGFSVNIP
jgi:methionine-rich copper-binding protein CopC